MNSNAKKATDHGKTILLAEDSEIVRNMVNEILVREGYAVVPKSDGLEAFDYFKQHGGEIDLIVTDIVMPNMDGKELGEQCRDHVPEIGILYMSGYADSRIDPDEDLGGNTDFIAKPFRPMEFLGKVRTLLNGESPSGN